MRFRCSHVLLLAVLALALLLHASGVRAEPVRSPQLQTTPVTSKISYQGQLSDASGTPLTGTYAFRFEWYAAPTGGTPLWHQTMNSVPVQNGLFSVQLDVQPSDMDGKALWLDITVNGQRLSPRQELLPAPYAFTLRPGAQVEGNTSDTLLDVVNTGGVAISAHSAASYGVFGQTLDDAEYYSAGVRGHSSHELTAGVMGTSDSGFGVYGKITDASNTHSAVVGYNEGQGNGVSGVSMHGIGVYGETEDDTEWEAAGVKGHSTNDHTFGVLGTSDLGIAVEGAITDPDNHNTAVLGYNTGAGGEGVVGYSESGDGVAGYTDSETSYAGRFENRAEGGAGVFAQGGEGRDYPYDFPWDPDLVLGGSAGTIYSDPDHNAGTEQDSDIRLISNHQVYVQLDADDVDSPNAAFQIRNADYELLLGVHEANWVYMPGRFDTKGPVCYEFDVPGAGLHPIPVPWFCMDALCWITAATDGTFGAQSPGLFWPTMVMQHSTDNSWIAGPTIGIAGLSLGGGTGTNGDGTHDGFGFSSQTQSGGVLRLLDDSSAENDPALWTVEFQPHSGELSQATLFACPMGQPFGWPSAASQSGSAAPPMVSE